MKINPYNQIHLAYKQMTEQAKQPQKSQIAQQDKVEISGTAKEMQSWGMDKSHKAKIDALQKQIDNGEYKVDEQAVAHHFYQYWNEHAGGTEE